MTRDILPNIAEKEHATLRKVSNIVETNLTFPEVQKHGIIANINENEADSDNIEDCESSIPATEEETTLVRFPDTPEVKQYIQNCKQFGVKPLSHALHSFGIHNSTLNAKHIQLSQLEFQALFASLMHNECVQDLNLEDTKLNEIVFHELCDVLLEKENIRFVNISYNKLNKSCFQQLSGMLYVSFISRLTLQSVGLDDSNYCLLHKSLLENQCLVDLDLSHNKLGNDNSNLLGKLLMHNKGIEKLNLSWNYIRRSSACAIGSAIAQNSTLTYLNLAFNGIGDDGAKVFGGSLKLNTTLLDLNIKDNRVTDEGAYHIAVGLSSNNILTTINISANLITPQGVQSILTGVLKGETVETLYMNHLSPDDTGIRAIAFLRQKNPCFKVEHGAVCTSDHKRNVSSDYIINAEIFARIRAYICAERLRLTDLFNIWDKKKDGKLSMEKIIAGLNNANIPVTKSMLEKAFKRLDKDNNGYIDYSEFIKLSDYL